jgi:threonine/homoserine/homoserine lactone efflux protein
VLDLHLLLAFIPVAALVIAVPGPSVLFLLGRALSLGRRPALLTVLGNAAGTTVQVVAVAAGLGVVARSSVLVFTAIKLLGAAYLIYLGVEAIRHRRDLAAAMQGPPSILTSDRRVFREGAVVGVTNPKTVVFMAAVLPQFTTTTGGAAPLPVQLLLLGLVFVAIAAVSDSVWAVTASGARRWLARSPRRISGIGVASGVVMMGLGARLAFTGRPS